MLPSCQKCFAKWRCVAGGVAQTCITASAGPRGGPPDKRGQAETLRPRGNMAPANATKNCKVRPGFFVFGRCRCRFFASDRRQNARVFGHQRQLGRAAHHFGLHLRLPVRCQPQRGWRCAASRAPSSSIGDTPSPLSGSVSVRSVKRLETPARRPRSFCVGKVGAWLWGFSSGPGRGAPVGALMKPIDVRCSSDQYERSTSHVITASLRKGARGRADPQARWSAPQIAPFGE